MPLVKMIIGAVHLVGLFRSVDLFFGLDSSPSSCSEVFVEALVPVHPLNNFFFFIMIEGLLLLIPAGKQAPGVAKCDRHFSCASAGVSV